MECAGERPSAESPVREFYGRTSPAFLTVWQPATLGPGGLLETLFIQLTRRVDGLPDPQRQVLVVNRHGDFVAYVDVAWTDLGVFNELDGQQHIGQPVYDASRETAVVAATGWLCGRFTWTVVTRVPVTTARKLAAIVEQCRRRPFAV